MTSNLFISKLKLKIPIIQAPMAGVSTVKLASAVTNNGGLGSIAFAASDFRKGSEVINEKWQEFKVQVDESLSHNVNFNFFSHEFENDHLPTNQELKNWNQIYNKASKVENKLDENHAKINISIKEVESTTPDKFEEFISTLIKIKPHVVSFHFGHPSLESIKTLQENGISVFVTATSVAEAKYLIDLGVDGIVCQGYEAGGHRGNFLVDQSLDENLPTSSLFNLIMKKLDTKNTFIIPSGGIVDGETISQYVKSGAAAVQMGTIFIPTPESSAPSFIKETIESNQLIPTIMTKLVSGKPARTLKIPFIERLVCAHEELSNKELPEYGYSYNRYKKLSSSIGNQFYLAGSNYPLIDTDLNAKQILDKLKKELTL